MSLNDATEYIYHSKLYKMLEDEETKLWYYSDFYLTNFLIEEYDTGSFDLSEVPNGREN